MCVKRQHASLGCMTVRRSASPNTRSLVDRIDRPPKWARATYIMRIQPEADPACTLRRLIEQEQLIMELTAKIAELKGVALRTSELRIDGRLPGNRPLKK